MCVVVVMTVSEPPMAVVMVVATSSTVVLTCSVTVPFEVTAPTAEPPVGDTHSDHTAVSGPRLVAEAVLLTIRTGGVVVDAEDADQSAQLVSLLH